MDVQLYVYDLSRGLARQMSLQFLGTHIDAVYHTSIVIEGIEYFYGAGIQSCRAGTTHHGQPMEKARLGRTELPIEIILEYLESLRSIYTAESYDLFLHNCNNFSNDFAMFLVGKGIPDHITSLPQTVLNTPFGQMLRPALDREMRTITQAPIPSQQTISQATNGHAKPGLRNRAVLNITAMRELESTLASASSSCAVVFFTSSTCAPCKILYPTYDELAEEAGDKAVLIKVDINFAQEIASKYNMRATPTIMTFLKGQKEEEWAGADVVRLRTSVQLLIHAAHPPHPHSELRVSSLLSAASKPVKYNKIPPLDKLIPKLGLRSSDLIIPDIKAFLTGLNNAVKQENPLPSLPSLAEFLQASLTTLPTDSLFAAYDLFRACTIDFRVCAFFAEDTRSQVVHKLLQHLNSLGESAPYNLRIVTLHLACNLLAPELSSHVILAQPSLAKELIQLVTTSLLDEGHANVRIAAASLAFNIAAANHRRRIEKSEELMAVEDQVELVAALIEAVGREAANKEALMGLVIALALFVYLSPVDGEVVDLAKVMDVASVISEKGKSLAAGDSASKAAVEVLTNGLR